MQSPELHQILWPPHIQKLVWCQRQVFSVVVIQEREFACEPSSFLFPRVFFTRAGVNWPIQGSLAQSVDHRHVSLLGIFHVRRESISNVISTLFAKLFHRSKDEWIHGDAEKLGTSRQLGSVHRDDIVWNTRKEHGQTFYHAFHTRHICSTAASLSFLSKPCQTVSD